MANGTEGMGAWLSFAVQLLVATASSFGNPRLAALVSTAPSGTPLAMLAADARNAEAGIGLEERQEKLLLFVEDTARGLAATAAFVSACWLAARAGCGVWTVLGSGFAAYFLWTSSSEARELQLACVLSLVMVTAWVVAVIERPRASSSTL